MTTNITLKTCTCIGTCTGGCQTDVNTMESYCPTCTNYNHLGNCLASCPVGWYRIDDTTPK